MLELKAIGIFTAFLLCGGAAGAGYLHFVPFPSGDSVHIVAVFLGGLILSVLISLLPPGIAIAILEGNH